MAELRVYYWMITVAKTLVHLFILTITSTEWMVPLPSAAAGAPFGRPAAYYSCGGRSGDRNLWDWPILNSTTFFRRSRSLLFAGSKFAFLFFLLSGAVGTNRRPLLGSGLQNQELL